MHDLLAFAEWLKSRGLLVASAPSAELVSEFLSATSPGRPLLDQRAGVELKELGGPVTVRGGERATLILQETRGPDAGRRFVLLRTANGDHVTILGPKPGVH